MYDYLISQGKQLLSSLARTAADYLPSLAYAADEPLIATGDAMNRHNQQVITGNMTVKRLKENAEFNARAFWGGVPGSTPRMSEQLRNGSLETTFANATNLKRPKIRTQGNQIMITTLQNILLPAFAPAYSE